VAKKLFSLLILSLLTFQIAFSATVTVTFKNPVGATSFAVIIDRVVNLVFWLGIALSPLFALFGVFHILTSGGDMYKIELGRRIIIFTIIGLIIVMFTKGIIEIILSLLR